MDVEKMMAHCNVAYELEYENIHPKPNGFVKLMLVIFVKNSVVGQNRTKRRYKPDHHFWDYLNKTQQLGETYFDGKESHSFGVLIAQEWSTMFSKHLDHHLTQFGV